MSETKPEIHLSDQKMAIEIVLGLAAISALQSREVQRDLSRRGDYRLVTHVESEDSKLGDALSISLHEHQPEEIKNMAFTDIITCQLYRVDRESPGSIIDGYPKSFSLSCFPRTPADLLDEADEILTELDRDELESAHLLLMKAGKVYDGELITTDKNTLLPLFDVDLSLLAQQEAERTRHLDQTAEQLDLRNDIELLYALKDTFARLHENNERVSLQHLTNDPSDNRHYVIEIHRQDGMLSDVFIALRENNNWQWQAYCFDESDLSRLGLDEEESVNWDREDLLEAINNGTRISRKLFDSYFDEAQRDVHDNYNSCDDTV